MDQKEAIDWGKVTGAEINGGQKNSSLKIVISESDVNSIKSRVNKKEDIYFPKTLKGKMIALIGENRALVKTITLTMQDQTKKEFDFPSFIEEI
jgi:hypothetical protein